MAKTELTPQEFELHVRDLRERAKAYLEGGAGDRRALLKDAEHVLELAASYAEVMERYPDVEGMVAEMLARDQQAKFLSGGSARGRESPGCLLGWLFGRGKG